MLNKNNTYFEEIRRIGHEWEAAREKRRARKQTIIDTFGWDSEEMKAWYEEDKAAAFPFSQGTSKAYSAAANNRFDAQEKIELAFGIDLTGATFEEVYKLRVVRTGKVR